MVFQAWPVQRRISEWSLPPVSRYPADQAGVDAAPPPFSEPGALSASPLRALIAA
jgi:hypothetical protein